ncbi:hypothetical protein OAI23_06530 [Alphaproteobacteria bacterium]|nr:hypothetical protein [Alphaproteobacteria bacterium]MDC1120373.1 hypothetical protein [Alphaproteobacteria bacterium]
MIFSTQVKSYLYEKIGAEDVAASSHWKFWHKHLQVDEEMNLIKSRGFGDGRRPYNKSIRTLHKLIQRRFVRKINQNQMLYFLEKLAQEKK